MSKTKITIVFKNVHLLWSFAQRVHPGNVEINTAKRTMICDCSEEDLKLLPEYEGIVVEEYNPHLHHQDQNK